MAKSPRRKFDLAAVIEAELGKAQPIELDLGSKVILVPQVLFWPDQVFRLSRANRDDEAAQLVLGDDYEAFCEAGGTALLLFKLAEQAAGASLPESKASTDS